MTKKVLIPLVAATLIGLVGCNHSDTPSSSEYVADLSEKGDKIGLHNTAADSVA